MMSEYIEEHNRTFLKDEDAEYTLLANFTARIVEETRIVDGQTTETILTITGVMNHPDKKNAAIMLPATEVKAEHFAGMGWVMGAWGVRAIIQPGAGTKESLRTAIQAFSRPTTKTIFRNMGWTTINGNPAYLHAGGAITAKGNDATVQVRLPNELSRYILSTEHLKKGHDAFWASIMLTTLPPKQCGWVLWAATYAPLYGECDFATHVTGRSGTFKSELTSLFQSHYGNGMDARHLPGSWSSTPNALEAQAYFCKNAVFAIDDFVPNGTAYQIRAYQTGADKIIRAQGNQAGRARLTDASNMQTTYYPRGLIMSTGEDTPEGHSVRARMMITELSPGDVDTKMLTMCQKQRDMLPTALSDVVRTLCMKQTNIEARANQIRDENIKIGHTRTPSMIGKLIATAEAVLWMAAEKKYLTGEQHTQFRKEMTENIIAAGMEQARYLESADPVQLFLNALRQALATGLCHLRTLNGGIPVNCTAVGWTVERSSGSMDTYKSHGPCLGWIDWDEDELNLEADSGFALLKKVAGPELALTKQTLFKRLKDSGELLRSDDARSRNTIRVTAEKHSRTVLCLRASTALDTLEKPNEER